jgi:hypothetical protein
MLEAVPPGRYAINWTDARGWFAGRSIVMVHADRTINRVVPKPRAKRPRALPRPHGVL